MITMLTLKLIASFFIKIAKGIISLGEKWSKVGIGPTLAWVGGEVKSVGPTVNINRKKSCQYILISSIDLPRFLLNLDALHIFQVTLLI